MAGSKHSFKEIVNLLKQELFNIANVMKGGPSEIPQAFRNSRADISTTTKDLAYLVPFEGFHPKIAIAIDFTHQFTLNTKGGNTAGSESGPSLVGQRLVDPAILRAEAQRIYKFARYYFEYIKMYIVSSKGQPHGSTLTMSDPDFSDEFETSVFLNEILNSFLTNITVTRTRREIGTASLGFRNVRNYKNGQSYTVLNNGVVPVMERLLVPMLPIKIWAKGRFYPQYYFPIFDGFIVEITVKDTNGFFELEMNCKDVLEIARISAEMINPAIIQIAELRENPSLNFMAKPFYGHDHMEIIKKLFVGGDLKFDPKREAQALESAVSTTGVFAENMVNLPGYGPVPKGQFVSKAVSFYSARFNMFASKALRSLSISKPNANPTTNTKSEKSETESGVDLTKLENFVYVSNTDKETSNRLFRPGDVLDDRGAIHESEFNLFRITQLASRNYPRNVIAWGSNLTPYRIWEVGNPDIWTSDFSSRFDIIKEIAELVYYDFYVDGNGSFHYHPQRFINDFLLNDVICVPYGSSAPKPHKDPWPGVQVIGPEELFNNSPSINIEEMITYLIVKGVDPIIKMDAMLGAIFGTAIDRKNIVRFGYRRQVVENPMFNYNPPLDPKPKDKKGAGLSYGDFLAATLIGYANAELYTTTCSIVFRPEIEVARPVYFVEDKSVFYVNSITHSITIGGDATTTINASYGRSEKELPPDINSFMTTQQNVYDLNAYKEQVNVEEFLRKFSESTYAWENYLTDVPLKTFQMALEYYKKNESAETGIETS